MTIAVSGALLTEPFAVTSSTRTAVFTAVGRATVTSIVVAPTSGTPTLSLSRYDGTTRTYFRTTVTMTAGTPYVWEVPFVLDPGGKIEVTSSASGGDMDGWVTYLNPVAPAMLR